MTLAKTKVGLLLFGLIALSFGLLAMLSLDWRAAAQTGPANFNFEEGQLGQLPTGWRLTPASQPAGYTANLTDERPKSGSHCAVIKRESDAPTRTPGNLMQAFEAAPFRGKRIRFRAAVRAEISGFLAQAQLWLRADRPPQSNGQPSAGFFDNMDDRPISAREWAYYEIIGDVEEDAQTINLGLLFNGTGKVWFDDASLEILGAAEKRIDEPARPLTTRGLENITAFTRLFGYVRHFHPSDEAAKTNWNTFAVEGMRAVESAKDAAELARKLEATFQPIAPTVRVFPSAQKPPSVQITSPTSTENIKVVAWHHIGFGTTNNPSYRSERVSKTIAEAKADAAMPSLTEPFQADLGGGVTCQVRLTLFADERGTLPRVSPMAQVENASLPKPTRVNYSVNDRATRLASITIAWNIFQHFYPYFDVVKTDWPAALKEGLQKAATDADERSFAATLKRLVVALHDGHGAISSVTDIALSVVPGIAWEWVEGQVVVTDVKPSVQGVAPGDVVTAVNGQPTAQVLAEKEALISGATPQWIRFRGLRALAAGSRNEAVTLEIEPFAARGERKQVTVKREFSLQIYNDKPHGKIEEPEPGIFYVNLDQVTDDEFNQALPKLAEAKGIIFELRGYPNNIGPMTLFPHLSDKPMTSAQWHKPEVTRPDHQQMKFVRGGEWDIQPQAPFLKAKKAFITDGRAISYAESCLGIIEYYKLGEIVGSTSAGTNGTINPFQLPGGYTVSWTGMKVLKHDGSQHHGVGIRPTIPVSRTRAAIAAGRDELLERAIQAVKN